MLSDRRIIMGNQLENNTIKYIEGIITPDLDTNYIDIEIPQDIDL